MNSVIRKFRLERFDMVFSTSTCFPTVQSIFCGVVSIVKHRLARPIERWKTIPSIERQRSRKPAIAKIPTLEKTVPAANKPAATNTTRRPIDENSVLVPAPLRVALAGSGCLQEGWQQRFQSIAPASPQLIVLFYG